MTRRGTLWFGWTLALLAIAGFARLGFWQYGRMHEKQALLAKVDGVLRERANMGLDSDAVFEISWVEGTATFDRNTFLLDNQMRDGRPGVHVYCIARESPGPARFVDLGWVPVGLDRRMPDVACPAAPMRIAGLMTPLPSSGLRMGPALQQIGPARWLMSRVDVDAIAEATGVGAIPRVVRLDPKLPGGYARDLDVLPNTLPPERHLGYAVQWWALALAVFVTALLLTFRKRRTPP